ncbi:MAG: PA14 domain-containing protein [Bacteroidota bacterium]
MLSFAISNDALGQQAPYNGIEHTIPVISTKQISDPPFELEVSFETEQLHAYADQWVATDQLGRILPDYNDCGDYRENRYVGLFYFLWHADIGTHNPIETYPDVIAENPESPPFRFGNYYWGELENGFYHPSDPWVLRRNLQMIANAGVDFVFIDFTNGAQGCSSIDDYFNVALEMYNDGIPVPKIAFFLNENHHLSMKCIWENVYNHPEYDPLLFYWEGKPLIMADSVKCATQCALCNEQSVIDFFTWRKTWAYGPDQWNFVDKYPQNYYSVDGKAEQIVVSKCLGSPNGADYLKTGSSYRTGYTPEYNLYWQTDSTPYGLFFQEQWTRAFEIDPSIVCITGWNELAGAPWPTTASYPVFFMGKEWYDPIWRCVDTISCISKDANGHHIPHGWATIDLLNQEFSRDIEPMKGGHTDSYYYQMVTNIRRYKGMSAPETIGGSRSITVDGSFDDWTDVSPLFSDPRGDVMNRDFLDAVDNARYTHQTARNDIVSSRVTRDGEHLYFYVKTDQAITDHTDPNWMLLFIDADRKKGSGWEGYDYVVNHTVTSPGVSTVKKWNGLEWIDEMAVTFAVNGNEMEISIPRSSLNMESGTPEFYFHWADNPQHLDDISSFFTDGESAPDRRFNYNYSTSQVIIEKQSPFMELTIPGVIEFEDFDNGGLDVAYKDADIENLGGQYRTGEGVDIAEISGGGYMVESIYPGEWMEYTTSVNAIGWFTCTITYASDAADNGIILYVDGKDQTGIITLPSTGSPETFSVTEIPIRLNAGTHLLKFHVERAGGRLWLDRMTFTESDVVYPGDGEGLIKSLWNGAPGGRGWFKDSLCSETDPVIDEAWGEESPGCGTNKDFWNARWQGEIEAFFSEEYTFYLTVNDMGRVWINNQLIIDAWSGAASGKTHSGTVALTAGEKVNIIVEYANLTGDGYAKLEWESSSNPLEVIPQSQLFPKVITDISETVWNEPVIYPNPCNGSFRIMNSTGLSDIRIYSVSGTLLHQERIDRNDMIHTHLQPGLYLLEINNTRNQAIKLIIEN